ncbi:hypothetical protein ACN27J_29330 [Solwaraspora sp. WMMB762]|uniref:hypothetical protein n=1 Tax=Solwaraspora sp. WMMB762 TaxID=3404120 RepID=UPI003B93B6E8
MTKTAIGRSAAGAVHRRSRATALLAASFAGCLLGAGLGAGAAHAAPLPGCGMAAVFDTEIHWGSSSNPWHGDADLHLLLDNRKTIIDGETVPAGTRLTWAGPDGNADITFGADGTFTGSARFPGEGGVGYRGTLAASTPVACDEPATYAAEIHWGSSSNPWHGDAETTIMVKNRRTIVDAESASAGTQLTWTGPNGNADITFGENGMFTGSARFPGEGGVGYRGSRKAVCDVAVFDTEIHWGSSSNPWHGDADLHLLLDNRKTIIDGETVPVGTRLTWAGPNGNADITFGENGMFTGSARFPGEGGVGYRGTLAASTPMICDDAAVFATEYRLSPLPWTADTDLTAMISNRRVIVDDRTIPADTTLAWTGPQGDANITFRADRDFAGTVEYPGTPIELRYRGTAR